MLSHYGQKQKKMPMFATYIPHHMRGFRQSKEAKTEYTMGRDSK